MGSIVGEGVEGVALVRPALIGLGAIDVFHLTACQHRKMLIRGSSDIPHKIGRLFHPSLQLGGTCRDFSHPTGQQ